MRTLSRSVSFFSARAILGLSSLIVSCADHQTTDDSVVSMPSPTMPSYEQFKADKYVPELDRYLVEGDLRLSEAQLRPYYDRMIAEAAQARAAVAAADGTTPLLVGIRYGVDVVWPSAEANNLTYCVDKTSFGTNYATMVSTISRAAREWEKHAQIRFVHDAAADDACDNTTPVVFNVKSFAFANNTVASAFFPDWGRADRELLVGLGAEGDTGVLMHELGHVLGFKHENNRQALRNRSDGDCNGWEDPEWRALTNDDGRGSIMDCDTGYTGLTAEDIRGVACEYGDVNGNLPNNCFIEGVSYRSHIGEFGWLGVMVNNDVSGSQGLSLSMQAIEISQNVRRGMKICYEVHAAYLGWLPERCDGEMAGTTGESRDLQAIRVRLVNAPPGCSVSYQVHLAELGWTNPVSDGAMAGTVGEYRGMQAMRVELSRSCF